jgi:hypothetical protein
MYNRQRSGGTEGSNPVPSSGESCANHWLRGDIRASICTSSTAFFSSRSPAFVGLGVGGTSGSNPLSSSRQSVSAVNAEAVQEKPCTLAAFCGWLGT